MNAEIPTNLPAPETVWKMFGDIYRAAIFRAALELEVWAKLATGPSTADALAAAVHWDPLGTRLLLDDLSATQYLQKDGDQYWLTPEAACYLLPDQPTYMGRFLLSEYGWEGNGRLADAIRTGKRPVGYKATTTEAIDTWIGAYVHQWAAPETALQRFDAMWKDLGIQAREGLRVLDVACGPAPKSLALARSNAGVCVTLLDWHAVLEMALRVATTLGVEKQTTLLKGDLWAAPFDPLHYDLIYMGNITHFHSPERNTLLFKKAWDALATGGVLVVDAQRREQLDPENPGLWFYAVSQGGATYSFDEYRDMLKAAGFTEIVDVNTKMMKGTKSL